MKLILIEVNIYFKHLIGCVFNYLGRKEEAIEDYTRAIEINP